VPTDGLDLRWPEENARAQFRVKKEFAELFDISVDFLSLIERGRNAPSFETLDRIAKRLKMTVAALFTFDRI